MKLDDRRSRFSKALDRYLGIILVMALAMVRPLLKVLWRRPRSGELSILVIKLSALGDAVVMVPALHLIRRHHPRARIDFLGGPSNRSFVESLSWISRFHAFGSESFSALLKEHYDLIIDFDQWVRTTALIAGLVPSGRTAGFQSERQFRHFAYDTVVGFDLTRHTAENFWRLARAAMQSVGPAVPGEFADDRAQSRQACAQELRPSPAAQGRGEYVVIHPGCGEHGLFREWPLASWARLVELLKKQHPTATVYVTGQGAYEQTLGEGLEKAGAVSLVGKLSFRELLDLLRGARAVFCCNTGVMHLASLFNDNLVALHGPTASRLWRPLWGRPTGVVTSPLACAPCLTWGNDYGCSDPVCVKVITPKQVLEAYNA